MALSILLLLMGAASLEAGPRSLAVDSGTVDSFRMSPHLSPFLAPVSYAAIVSGKIKHLGELVLRVDDLETMRRFYEDVVGLELFADESDEGRVFLRIADAVDGHPQLLGLFVRPKPEHDPQRKIMDHFAFVIDREDYADEFRRLE